MTYYTKWKGGEATIIFSLSLSNITKESDQSPGEAGCNYFEFSESSFFEGKIFPIVENFIFMFVS